MENDPVCGCHHDMFAHLYDAETCQLMDPDVLHPFCLASKLNADNYLSFKEILRMDKELWEKWFDAMDKELQDLFKSKTFEFVSQDEVLKQDKEIVLMTWAFKKQHHSSGEVYHFKARMCVWDLQCDRHTNNERFAPVVEWATFRMLFSLSIIEGWSMASIDFKNTFVQATSPKPI